MLNGVNSGWTQLGAWLNSNVLAFRHFEVDAGAVSALFPMFLNFAILMPFKYLGHGIFAKLTIYKTIR